MDSDGRRSVPQRSAPQPSPRIARDTVEVLIAAVIFALFARTWLVQAFRVPSDSMAPGLVAGDHLLVNKFVFADEPHPLLPIRDIARNDLVVFPLPTNPNEVLVKRCVATGGARIEIRDKELRVDNVLVDEPWIQHLDERTYPRSRFAPRELRLRDNFGPIRVPRGHAFCLGDNRDVSRDSRTLGSIPGARAVGRPLLIYWSAPIGGGGDSAGPAGSNRLRRWLGGIRRFFTEPRPERIMRWAR